MRRLSLFLCAVMFVSGKLMSQSSDSVNRKVSPSLLQTENISKVTIEISDSVSFANWIGKHPEVTVTHVRGKFFRISGFNKKLLSSLGASAGVKSIDRADRKARVETVLGDFDLSVNAVTAVHGLFPIISGNGLAVSIKEKPFDKNDIDLRGRVIINDQFDEGATAHATFMATIAAGGGNTSPYGKGVAWGAGITTSDFEELLPDDGAVLTASGVSVQNHSYGVGVENYYGVESAAYDDQALDFPKILHVFSSGNDGDKTPSSGPYAGVTGFANLTGQFKVSKNTIAVGTSDRYGNVVARSSRGPAYDGRVKPELIAFGDAGSSEAAAVVSGIALMLQDVYSAIHGGLPDAALVKGVLINSAKDTGRPHVDYETGYGSVNALNAIRTINDGTFRAGAVGADENTSFTVSVPPGQHELKITLIWNDPPAEAFASTALVNDLDLTVRHVSSADSWKPWVLDHGPAALQGAATRNVDRINNIEQVTVSQPAAGEFQISVHGYSVVDGTQPFFVVFETTSGFEWISPVRNTSVRSDVNHVIRWQWANAPAQGTLEYRVASAGEWTFINTVDLVQSYYEWDTPDTAANFQLRMVVGPDIFESDSFPVSAPDRLKVGFNCDEQVFFLWNRVAGADAYVLYSLGEKYLEPALQTTDTFAIIEKNAFQTNYFSVAPKINGLVGQREFTIDYNTQGVGCYFIAFLPRLYFVTAEAVFDVKIGTRYNITSAVLERFTNGTFETIQVISPVAATDLTFTDPDPRPGAQLYRAGLLTDDGTFIYSDSVEVFYLRKNDLFVYPNPVKTGEEISIVVSDDSSARIELFDLGGRLVRTTSDFGPVKIMSTSGLPGGAYVLKVKRSDGRVSMSKVIIV
jgi:hypothetical protein